VKVLSVDLAHTAYEKLGVVILEERRDSFSVQRLAARDLELTGLPSPQVLATRLAKACRDYSASILLLDGPQGWKHPGSDVEHSRVCERVLNTPGKTGVPGCGKPASYLPFIAFSIAVFEALVTEGFALWSGRAAPCLVLESFPLAAWRQLGVVPLPAKSKARTEHLERVTASLRRLFPLHVEDGLSHDELQALVVAPAGVAIARGCCAGCAVAGVAPSLLEGTWREGFIVSPTREALTSCA